MIFITAYPERLLTGEAPERGLLITKPFLPDMVKAVVVSQALFFETRSKAPDGNPPDQDLNVTADPSGHLR